MVVDDVGQELSGIHTVAGEVTLYRAVIARAFRDALYESELSGKTIRKQSSESRRLQDDAREWLLTDDDDFVEICQLALLEPDAVRTAARKALRAGNVTE